MSIHSDRSLFRNLDELIAGGQRQVRRDALEIVEAGIRGVDPGERTLQLIHLDGDILRIGQRSINLQSVEHIYVVGAGKGSFPIAAALDSILGSRIDAGVVVVKRGEKRRLKHIEILEAGHPIPDEDSIVGAKKIIKLLENTKPNDLVFAAVTGGASALATLPLDGITLREIQELTELLLKCGVAIQGINSVRKHLCRLKGGRLITYIHPAEAITLTLNTDPEGMPWPDMCLPDPSTFEDAVQVLQQYDLWDKVAPSITNFLLKGRNNPEFETLKSLEGMRSTIFSVGDPVTACELAAEKARQLGYTPMILSTNIEGEAKDIGICLAGIAKEIIKYHRPLAPPCALISGGETTVTITEECEAGGPNQETALGFAYKFKTPAEVACVAIDTDGTDGPTEIAGGIVCGDTYLRALNQQIKIEEFIQKHNSSELLTKLNGAIITGHTGTNVMNLRVVLVR